MRSIAIAAVCLVNLGTAAAPGCIREHSPTFREIKKLNDFLAPRLRNNSIPARRLAQAVFLSSRKYNIDSRALASVLLVESGGVEAAVNSATHDYGIAQLHKPYSIECAMHAECAIDEAAARIAKMHRLCEYNLGPKGKFVKYATQCKRYERLLASAAAPKVVCKHYETIGWYCGTDAGALQ